MKKTTYTTGILFLAVFDCWWRNIQHTIKPLFPFTHPFNFFHTYLRKKAVWIFCFCFSLIHSWSPYFFSWVTFPIIFLNIHLMLKKYMKEFYMFLYMSRIIKCLWLDKQWKKRSCIDWNMRYIWKKWIEIKSHYILTLTTTTTTVVVIFARGQL